MFLCPSNENSNRERPREQQQEEINHFSGRQALIPLRGGTQDTPPAHRDALSLVQKHKTSPNGARFGAWAPWGHPPHAQQEAGTSQHPLGFTALTLHRQVGGGRRRAAQAVAGDTGVFSSIFWLHPENDQRAINQDPHPQLQVTAREERGEKLQEEHGWKRRCQE